MYLSPLACDTNSTTLNNLVSHNLYDVSMQVKNEFGAGPESPIYTEYSGQNAPYSPPRAFKAVDVTASTVALTWAAIDDRVTIDWYEVRG